LSPRWFFIPEHQHLSGSFDFFSGLNEIVKSGKAEIITTGESLVVSEEFNLLIPIAEFYDFVGRVVSKVGIEADISIEPEKCSELHFEENLAFF